MDERIKNLLATLAVLQRADSARAALEKNLAGVEQRLSTLQNQLMAYQEQLKTSQGQLEQVKKQYRTDEVEIKSIDAAIVKSDEKLGYVKTNKEYQSMLKEIDDLKLKKSDIEDRMLSVLDQIETVEKKVICDKADLEDMKREVEEKQKAVRSEAEAQQREVASLHQEREEIWAELDPKMQKMYARAMHQGHGVAVAAVIEGVCQVCRMNIPPQAYIELMRLDALSLCPNCQRIIYPKAVIEVESAGVRD
ncbi:MAG: C4-type zinc ribbon domain-containing protein [Desulfobacteraceae bacterium]|nr:C4-type zinc ribbon domain-containing protein [Desulfobacteraceae bacterium]